MVLQMVGYWGEGQWVNPEDLVDETWDGRDRDDVIYYLCMGFHFRAYMGYAKCRICGALLGTFDMTDGVYVWPEHLEHYLKEHHVRLPDWFVAHVLSSLQKMDDVEMTDALWSTVRPGVRMGTTYDLFATVDLKPTSDGGIKIPFGCPVYAFEYRFRDTGLGAAMWIEDTDGEITPGQSNLNVRLASWLPQFLDDAVEGEEFTILYNDRIVGNGTVVRVLGEMHTPDHSFAGWPKDHGE